MSLAKTGDLVADAQLQKSAVFAFNVISLEHAEGIVLGAEKAGSSVLLQLSENAGRFHGRDSIPIIAACRALAIDAEVPVAIHLDHLRSTWLTPSSMAIAAAAGITSAMIDAAHLPYEENVAMTARFSQDAHKLGLWVESELGEIGGKDGAHAPGVRTDPGEALDFVKATGVDALAVAVGSSHAMTTQDASLDLDLVERLARLLPVPLVLHGSSGVPDALLRLAVEAGIRKINIGTGLNVAFTGEIRRQLELDSSMTDPRKYLSEARGVLSAAVAHLLSLAPISRP